jgi:hypothetical protein
MFLQSANGGILLRKCPRLHIKTAIWVKKYPRLHIEFAIWVKKYPLLRMEMGIFFVKFPLKKLLGDVDCFAIPVGEDILFFKLIFRCPFYEFVIK